MRVYNEPIFSSGSVVTASLQSFPLYLEHSYGFAIQALYSNVGTNATCSLKLQASCDPGSHQGTSDIYGINVTNWTDISGSAVTVGNSTGSALWNVEGAFYRWVRLAVVTDGTTTGSLTARLNSKGI